MGLFSFLQRPKGARPQARAATQAADESVELLRSRARRRLIGAAVLVVLAVLILPLVFESKPRSLDPSISVNIVRRETVTPGQGAAPVPVPQAPSVAVAPPPLTPAGSGPAVAGEKGATSQFPAPAAQAPTGVSGAQGVSPSAAPDRAAAEALAAREQEAERVAAEQARVQRAASEQPAAEKAAAEKAAAQRRAAEKAEVERMFAEKATSERKGEPAAAARYLVQVGAFAEASTVREARQRLTKLGLRVTEQPVDTSGGRRTRVRVGPFESRDEAERVLARVHAAGLPGIVVSP